MNSVETTLLTLGIACMAAAIIGGGFKALGVEIPALQSGVRQTALGLLGFALVFIGVAPTLVRQIDPAPLISATRTPSSIPSASPSTLPENPSTIAVNGPPARVSISAPGQRVILAFSGSAGQNLRLFRTRGTGDFANAGAIPVLITIVTPDGNRLLNNTPMIGDYIDPIRLRDSGEYQLVVVGRGDLTGSLMFTLQDVPG